MIQKTKYGDAENKTAKIRNREKYGSFFSAINNERKGVKNDSEHRKIKRSIKG